MTFWYFYYLLSCFVASFYPLNYTACISAICTGAVRIRVWVQFNTNGSHVRIWFRTGSSQVSQIPFGYLTCRAIDVNMNYKNGIFSIQFTFSLYKIRAKDDDCRMCLCFPLLTDIFHGNTFSVSTFARNKRKKNSIC